MSKLVRLVLTFTILIAMVFMTLGYYAAFRILRKQHKTEIKQLLRSGGAKELQEEFTFSQAEYKQLDWKDEKEFMLNGNMYDVLKKELLPSGKYRLICHHDLNDQTIFAFLTRYHKQQTGNDQHQQTIKLLQLLSIADIPTEQASVSPPEQILPEIYFVNHFRTSYAVKPATPPPKA